jgi:hypothetical protein
MSKKPPDKPVKPKPKAKVKKKLSNLEIVEVARPGSYRINAPDLLHSIALRKNLQEAIEHLKVKTKAFVEKHSAGAHKTAGHRSGGSKGGSDKSGNKASGTDEAQDLLDAVQKIDDATKPIAYGVGDHPPGEDPCEG